MFQIILIKAFILLTMRTLASTSQVIDDEFNVNDILRTDLMPTYFIVDEENKTNTTKFVMNNRMLTSNGSIDAALSTLDFHR